MSKTVYNQKEDIDFLKQPMFFGEECNVQRFDQQKYPIFEKLTQSQLGYFWRPEEVSLQKDRNDYLTLNEAQKFIFTANLKYQTLLDSVQGRGPAIALLPYASIPELEPCIIWWDAMETLHSRSYTHIMKNVYAQPEKVLDSIIIDEHIKARSETVTADYDNFINRALSRTVNNETLTDYDTKKLFYKMLVSINILEGIRFYVSFACSFAFGEMKLMEGSAKIISFIARDESLHLAITQNIINNYRKYENDKVMLQVIKDCHQEVVDMYNQTVEQEKQWANHLFSHGSMIGLSDKILHNYVEFMANKRMKAIGLDPIYDQPANTNPLPWTQNWLSSKGLQEAPQETEKESYIIGGIKHDIDDTMINELSL